MRATSIEQSKRLLGLGLNPQSADMYYWCGADLRIGGYKARCEDLDIPAWSLSALLELMPGFEFWATSEKKYSITCDWYQSKEFDNAFDAVYDLMVLLLENKCIK